jgi:hypothetical protein
MDVAESPALESHVLNKSPVNDAPPIKMNCRLYKVILLMRYTSGLPRTSLWKIF